MTAKLGFLQERMQMWRAFRKDFFHTGSLIPSSRFLGRELAIKLNGNRPPARILEIGPGTGPVTAQIVPLLQPGDQFDAIEINSDFVAILEQRFPQATKAVPTDLPAPFRLLHAPLQELPGTGIYQHLISGLPFNNFPIELVELLWQSIHRLAAPGATFSFFEYIAIRSIKMPFARGAEKQRLRRIGDYLAGQMAEHQIQARHIYRNVPPAVVHHLRLPGNPPQAT